MTVRFADPFWLLLLLPILLSLAWAVLGVLRSSGEAAKSGPSLRFSSLTLLRGAGLVAAPWKTLILPLCRFLALVCVVVALARPQFGHTERVRKASGLDIVLALDVSGSMQALDFALEGERVDRLTMLKSLADEFVYKRPADRMGLVAFGAEAFTLTPATLDHELLRQQLSQLEIGMAGDGTAIGDALGVSVKRLEDLDSKSRIVLLFTDGANNRGVLAPRLAAEVAASKAVKVYTIAIGREGPVPVAAQGFFGMERIVERRFPIDFELLEEIAQKTGAQAFRAENTEELREIYALIDELEKSEFEIREYTNYQERMEGLVVSALLLLLGEMALARSRRLRRLT